MPFIFAVILPICLFAKLFFLRELQEELLEEQMRRTEEKEQDVDQNDSTRPAQNLP